MASLEDVMAGLFGETQAPAGDEMRRRRGGPAGGGIGGAAVTAGQMMPYYGGIGQYDFSGAMGGRMGGRQGLMSLLGGRDVQGPALRHFARQGFDFNPPGQDNREMPGGPNIAPGNIDTGRALDQPQGNLTPGVPQGVARGFGAAPGQVQPTPRTQGWRNLAPGYSAAAQFGTDPSGRPLGFGGAARQVGAPGAAGLAGGAPGASMGGARLGGRAGPVGGSAPTQSQNAIGGGVGAVAPAGPAGGGGAGGTTGGGGGAGARRGGGGGGGQGQGPRPTPIGQPTGNNQIGVNAPPAQQQAADQRAAGNIARGAGNVNLGGSSLLDALGAIQDMGNAGTGQGGKGLTGPRRGEAQEEMEAQGSKLAGLTPKQRAARKAAWQARVENRQENREARQAAKAARQEAARVAAAPSASQFGAQSATNDRGTGLAPLPRPGRTRPVRSTSNQQR